MDHFEPPHTNGAELSEPASESALLAARSQRNAAVDDLKGIAILGVVLHHLGNRRLGPQFATDLQTVVLWFSWSVSAFIFLAGWLRAKSIREYPVVELIRRRARRLLVPYLVVGILYAALAQIIQRGGLADRNPSAPPDFAGKLFTVLRGDPAYGEQLYFFPLLFVIEAIFIVVHAAMRGRSGALLTLAASAGTLSSLLLITHTKLPTTGLSKMMVLAGLFQYALGYLIGMANTNAWARRVAASTSVVLILAAGAAWRWDLAVPFVPIALFFVLNSFRLNNPAWSPFRLLGAASATIFLFHTPFVLQSLIVLFSRARAPAVVNVTASAILTLLICLGLHWILNRFSFLKALRV